MTLKIAVLGSTRGTDLQGILDAMKEQTLTGIDIQFVLSDKKDAYILTRAQNHGLKTIFLDPKQAPGNTKEERRERYDAEISRLCEEHGVDLIVLIGYMKIMSEPFVRRWWNRICSVHPSLLDMFAGTMDKNTHQMVLDRGVKVTGPTLHFVDTGVDTGPIIMQKPVLVADDDTVDTLKAKVQAKEVEMFLEFLPLYRDGKVRVIGTHVYLSK